MKEKYVEHDFPRYFIFGEHKDGRVDIASERDDAIATVSKDHAEKLIADRNAIVQRLCDIALAFDKVSPDAFTLFWYGSD